jgi:hypothetical protein
LLSGPARGIHVVIAVITANKGDSKMKPITEETATAPDTAGEEQPKGSKKAALRPRRAPVTPAKGKSGKKATPAKKAPTGAKKAKGAKDAKAAKPVREGSKTDRILELLKRPGGVTAKELMRVTNWQAHSLRGFLSGTVGKKMGLTVTSTKGDNCERTYSVEA